jgi:hypothetical protein
MLWRGREEGPWNGGTSIAVLEGVKSFEERPRRVRIASKSVFEVNDSRLGIGNFSRPLLDAEARSLRKAWEMEAMPGFDDFQVEAKRVSFVARPDAVMRGWETLDRLLARTSEPVKKAS